MKAVKTLLGNVRFRSEQERIEEEARALETLQALGVDPDSDVFETTTLADVARQ